MKRIRKDDIYQQVRLKAVQVHGEQVFDGMSCIYWMEAGLVVLRSLDYRAIPAAGTAHFLVGEPNEYLSYEWNGAPETALHSPGYDPAKTIPEMHCFIWLPDTMEVVDFSVGSLPTFAEKIGLKWRTPLPPPFYWDHPNKLSPDALYLPNLDATKLAVALMKQMRKAKT